jgi:ferredoxin-NADP reductase
VDIMSKPVYEKFDGYAAVAEEREVARRQGIPFAAECDSAERYIRLLHPPRLELRVADIIEDTPTTETLRLVSESGYLPPFQAGQYIALFLEIGSVRTTRAYSISSPPTQVGHYDITVRRVEDGLVSGYLLCEVRRGDVLESSGPVGHFYHNPLFHDPTTVFLAGGSGVTPFMSMIREIVQRGVRRTVHLFHGSQTLDDVIFRGELEHLSQRFENIHYVPVIENPSDGYRGRVGLITGEVLAETLGDLADKTFYVCGPHAMYGFCEVELDRLGVPRNKVRFEAHGPPANVCDEPGWPASVAPDAVFTVQVNGEHEVRAPASQPLLVTLEQSGLLVPSLCRSGECSMCRVKILSGRVYQPAGTMVRKSDRRRGYAHACAAYPLESLELAV